MPFTKDNRAESSVFVVSEKPRGYFERIEKKTKKKIEILKPYDTYNLLANVLEINTIDDITINDDRFGLLDTDTLRIFKQNVPSSKKGGADFVARRKAMNDKDFCFI
jgi:hypothetical protein